MKKRIFAIAFVISVVLGLSACKNPPIFAAIEQEVKLKQASVKGFVRGVVKVNDKLYTSNHLFPIDTDNIEGVKIISTSKYRSNRAYKVAIKLKGRFFRYTFGIGHISEDKEQKKYDYFLKELKKRHIDYEIK